MRFSELVRLLEVNGFRLVKEKQDHLQTLREQGLPVPTPNLHPTITIENERKPNAA